MFFLRKNIKKSFFKVLGRERFFGKKQKQKNIDPPLKLYNLMMNQTYNNLLLYFVPYF